MPAAKIERNLLPDTCTLRDVMSRLNEGVNGIVLLVDRDGVLCGVATDGDIRRAIISGRSLDTLASSVASKSFVFGHASANSTVNLALLNDRIRHLPIIDTRGRPVDLLTWAELWRTPLVRPFLGGNETKYLNDCLASGWISSQGPYIERFQTAFQEYLGDGRALCTSSGTTALHLALMALGIGRGDEVIVPDLTFGATANVVMHAGATPVFVDVDPITWTLDPSAMRSAISPRTKAVIPVHLYGHPCDMDPIMELAKKHDLKVVEDCAEALGAEYKGRKVGLIGDVGCFSFFANKVITTGEGGMAITANGALYDSMSTLRDHGMSKTRRYWHLSPGYNYRMTNLQAAIGLAQIEKIDDFLLRRIKMAECYNSCVEAIDGLEVPPKATWARNIYWLYTVLVNHERLGINRDQLAAELQDRGVETRPVFHPLRLQPAYENCMSSSCSASDDISSRGLSLPTGNDMTIEDAQKVCDAILHVLSTQPRHQSLAN